MKKNNRGFTLIEVITVTVILAIVLTLFSSIIYSIISFKNTTLVDSETKDSLYIIETVVTEMFNKYDNSNCYFYQEETTSDNNENKNNNIIYFVNTSNVNISWNMLFNYKNEEGNFVLYKSQTEDGQTQNYEWITYNFSENIKDISMKCYPNDSSSTDKCTILICTIKYMDMKNNECTYQFVLTKKSDNPTTTP